MAKRMKSDKKQFREMVADMFVNALEEDPLAFFKGWDFSETGKPVNAHTDVQYRGVNVLYLKMMEHIKGYGDPRWMSWTQIKQHKDLHLKAGAQGAKVEYWMPVDNEANKAMTWDAYNRLSYEEKHSIYVDEDGDTKEKYSIKPKYFTVFNGADIEGLDRYETPDLYLHQVDPAEVVSMISDGMQVPIEHVFNSSSAYYSPVEDIVHLPAPEQFHNNEEYNRTALHELGHATGHERRLARDQTGSFGSKAYAYEELVAEITSCFMSEYVPDPITKEGLDQHKAYVQSWASAIKDNKNYLFKAIKDAEKASDYMIEKGELTLLKEKNLEQSSAFSYGTHVYRNCKNKRGNYGKR